MKYSMHGHVPHMLNVNQYYKYTVVSLLHSKIEIISLPSAVSRQTVYSSCELYHFQTKELEELGISGGGERHSAQSKRKSIHQPPASRGSLRSRKSTTTREDFGHIPYRNSLLTMVLKDSLGMLPHKHQCRCCYY